MDEALSVLRRVPELHQSKSPSDYAARLDGSKCLILVAEQGDDLVGFKVGYALDKAVFYSWVGGVVPGYRKGHVALRLLERQEAWVARQGFERIRVRTMPKFRAMIGMLERQGYALIEGPNADGKLMYECALRGLPATGQAESGPL